MVIPGEARAEGPYFFCSLRTVAGAFGGEVEFLLDTGASFTLLSLRDFQRLGGRPADLRPTNAVRLTSLSGSIPCRILPAGVLEFQTEGGMVPLTLDPIFVPEEELWAPNLLGRDFLGKSGWQFRYQPGRHVCEFVVE